MRYEGIVISDIGPEQGKKCSKGGSDSVKRERYVRPLLVVYHFAAIYPLTKRSFPCKGTIQISGL